MKKSIQKWMSALLAGALLLPLAACTKQPTGSTGQGSGSKDTLVLGTSADYAPFEYHKMIDGKDTILGFDIALAQQIADDMGKELVIKDMEFNSLITELNNGTIDFIIAGFTPDEERKKQVDFSECYYYGEQICIIQAKDKEQYTSLESLAKQPVAAQTGTIYEGIVKDMMPDSQLISLAKVPDLFLQLSGDKVKAVILDRDSAEGYLAQDKTLAVADFEIPYEVNGSAVAVKKGNSELLEEINKTIADVTESGKMKEFIAEAKAQAPAEE